MHEGKVNRQEKPATLWNRSFIIVFLTGVCTGMSSYMVTPLISKYALSLGAALPLAGTVASIMSIAALICRPFSGAVSDRTNRKALMIVSTLLAALTIGASALTDNIAMLIVIRAIHGVAFSFMTVANMALASSLIPEHMLGRGMGYLGLSSIFASAVGPGFGMYLSENFGFTACFLLAMTFMLVGGAFMFAIPYRQQQRSVPEERHPIRLSNLFAGELTGYMLILALFSCGNGLISTYIALIGDERGISSIGLFFTAYSIVVVAIRPFVGSLLDRKGLSIILIPSLVVAATGMVLIGAASALWMVVLAGALKALGQGSGSPSIQAHSIKALGKERAGVASSTCFIGQDIGNGVAPIVGGLVATNFGYSTMFYGYAFILVVIGILTYVLQRVFEKKKRTAV